MAHSAPKTRYAMLQSANPFFCLFHCSSCKTMVVHTYSIVPCPMLLALLLQLVSWCYSHCDPSSALPTLMAFSDGIPTVNQYIHKRHFLKPSHCWLLMCALILFGTLGRCLRTQRNPLNMCFLLCFFKGKNNDNVGFILPGKEFQTPKFLIKKLIPNLKGCNSEFQFQNLNLDASAHL